MTFEQSLEHYIARQIETELALAARQRRYEQAIQKRAYLRRHGLARQPNQSARLGRPI